MRLSLLLAVFAALNAAAPLELQARASKPWPSRRIPADLAARARTAAVKNGLDPALFQAVVWAEGGRLGDRGTGQARGPAQITRSAADAECPDLGWKAVRTKDAANLECGARILSRRGLRYLGKRADPMIAASLYNTKMKHWKRIAERRRVPAFPETVSYVTRISRYYCQLTGRRLLVPARHLDPRLIALSRRVDREMGHAIASEGQTPRRGCSPAY